MLQIPGHEVYSHFRHKRVLADVQKLQPEVVRLSAEYVYWVDTAQSLSPEEIHAIRALLRVPRAIEQTVQKSCREDACFLITPRLGTISAWSSKATEIARMSQLNNIIRVERGRRYSIETTGGAIEDDHYLRRIAACVHDQMTESVLFNQAAARAVFATVPTAVPQQHRVTSVLALHQALGLSLSEQELELLSDHYARAGRLPTEAEMMMFAQVNSEHCRHKIFNAHCIVAGKPCDASLFDLIRATYQANPDDMVVAYRDNAAIAKGGSAALLWPDTETGCYRHETQSMDFIMKVETHNHPTAISPMPGAATGVGGELRDEAATGRGSRSKAGLAGFMVSNLRLPGHVEPWEKHFGKPSHIASAIEIMLQAPIGSARYGNEFGRPTLTGFFRAFETTRQSQSTQMIYGYHKPVMIAGGIGEISATQTHKRALTAGGKVVVLGGPGLLIGLGGGGASSVAQGQGDTALDFASVQRDNPEMGRRAQELINRCWQLGARNPIAAIHDVGAGGLSNAVPELVHEAGLGAIIDLRAIPLAAQGLSAMEIWCNEAQERFVATVASEDVAIISALARQERCPMQVIGELVDTPHLILEDRVTGEQHINMPLDLLLESSSHITRHISALKKPNHPVITNANGIALDEALHRVLAHPTVGDKSFLVTIADRSVGGLVARDQMIGPWQVPVADVSVIHKGFMGVSGEAMAMAERSPLAVSDPAASVRIAAAELLTNCFAADIPSYNAIKVSANWMAACGYGDQDAKLLTAVTALSEFCCDLGLCIPVGKDSLSMQTQWQQSRQTLDVVSPVTLVLTGFSQVADCRKTLTPLLQQPFADTRLLLLAADNQHRMAGSILSQVYQLPGDDVPDISVDATRHLIAAINLLKTMDVVLAYHDRSDGGLITTLCEMAFASRAGLTINLDEADEIVPTLFSEAPGVVLQVPAAACQMIASQLEQSYSSLYFAWLGDVTSQQTLTINHAGRCLLSTSMRALHQTWSHVSHTISRLRDNPACADSVHQRLLDEDDPGLHVESNMPDFTPTPWIGGNRPQVAILREQGVNGQSEMAAAFIAAGLSAVDVPMQALLAGDRQLHDFSGLAVCGGFSYGDVLGAGRGWALSILNHPLLRSMFVDFFNRDDTFTLGVCNGCQMLSHLRELIPGTSHWPTFMTNASDQFEARLCMVELLPSVSMLFDGMVGSRLPIVVSHGEGRACFTTTQNAETPSCTTMRYVDNYGHATTQYPANPNGSPGGATGFCSHDGRVNILMPHPERVFLKQQFSWYPKNMEGDSPWMRLFHNAARWLTQ